MKGSKNENLPTKIHIPYHLSALLKVLNVTKACFLQELIDTISSKSLKPDLRQELTFSHYLITRGYGDSLFSKAERREMLNELRDIVNLFSDGSTGDEPWRKQVIDSWFRKWSRAAVN